MGAGDYPTGIGPAGFDPPTTADRLIPTLPLSGYFDPHTRDFPLDENGEIEGVHPVDQAVAMALGIVLAGASPAPAAGLDIERIKTASRAALQSTITDAVKVALADLISRADIAFIAAPLVPTANGRPFFEVVYTNLRLPSSTIRRPKRTRVTV